MQPHPHPHQYGEAQRHLEAHQEDPSFLLALAYVLAQTTPEQVADDVRQLAGLLLKNYVLRHAQPFVRGEIRGGGGAGGGQQGVELRDYVKHQVGRLSIAVE